MEMKDRIRHLRKDVLKISQEDFANRLGITKVTVSYYEAGKRYPSQAQSKNIAQVTGVSLEWLMNGTGPMFITESREEEIINLVTRLMKDAPEGTKAAAVELILKYPDDEWSKLYEALSTLSGYVRK